MALSTYAHMRILEYYFAGYNAPTIEKNLWDERIPATRVGIWKFLKKYTETGTIARREGSGRPTVLTSEVRLIVERQMLKDDETTAYQVSFQTSQFHVRAILITFCLPEGREGRGPIL